MKLATPIAPESSVRIRMRWYFDLVADKGWKEGAIDETTYFLAYFFPRVTNYSDYNGWTPRPSPWAASSTTTSPTSRWRWKPARLRGVGHRHAAEPGEVLQPETQRRLEASYTSDQVVTLADAADVKAGKVTARGERLVWKWQAAQVPDFAVALSNHYRWTRPAPWSTRPAAAAPACRRPTRQRHRLQADGGHGAEGASVRVQHLSGRAVPYPKTTIVLGSADEEYPMMVNDSSNVGSAYAATLPENAFTGFVPRTRSCTAGSRSTRASTRSAIRSWTRAGPPPSSTCATARC